MNIIKFTREGGTEPELFACGKCGVLQSKLKFCGADDAYAASIAEECCSPRECSVCGLNIERFRTMCSACAESDENGRWNEKNLIQGEYALAEFGRLGIGPDMEAGQ